jgi:hypothetical protein
MTNGTPHGAAALARRKAMSLIHVGVIVWLGLLVVTLLFFRIRQSDRDADEINLELLAKECSKLFDDYLHQRVSRSQFDQRSPEIVATLRQAARDADKERSQQRVVNLAKRSMR